MIFYLYSRKKISRINFGGICMINISVEEYAKMHVRINPDNNVRDVVALLKSTLKRKKAGAACDCCRMPIWAIGSAFSGFDGCFTCITGEHDCPDDYEVF